MTPFGVVTARAAVLDGINIDTDQIIPARFLRKPRSAGYGNFLFHDLVEARSSVLGAGILFAGGNFGCGSSREGAVYALADAGIRCVVAPSFGDIFASNAGKNGLLALALPEVATHALRMDALAGGTVTVDLPQQRIRGSQAGSVWFEMEPFQKRALIDGLDDVGITLSWASTLEGWTARDRVERPWVLPVSSHTSDSKE